jgi:death on curing protein
VIHPSSEPANSGPKQPEPRWVSRVIVDAMHSEILRTLGGSHGIRDKSLVESALARPKNLFAYSPTADLADLADLAATYGFGLAKNHGYVDGNERTAYQVMFVFMDLNGFTIVAPDEADVVRTMLGVADGAVTESDLAAWVRAAAQPNTKHARLKLAADPQRTSP